MGDDSKQPDLAAAEEGPVGLYELFIAILTVMSLGVAAVLLLLPNDAVVQEVLIMVDGLFCAVFLLDFVVQLWHARRKTSYLFWQGMADLIGALPIMPALRLLRVFRLARIARHWRAKGSRRLRAELGSRRPQLTLYLMTIFSLALLTAGSFFVLYFEDAVPAADIHTGGDAIWWSLVTMTTVGYGDYAPVTHGGRVVAIVLMIVGIGVYSVVTGFLASHFLKVVEGLGAGDEPRVAQSEVHDEAPDLALLAAQLGQVQAELAEIKSLLHERG